MRITVVAKAILVAVPQYEHHPPLPKAAEAARRLADDLSSAGYEIARDLLEGGGRDEIARRLRDWIGQAGDGTTLILFWAGHAQSEAEAHYLVCRDSPRSGLTGIDAIPAADIGVLIAKSSAEKVLVIFDTCFSGGNAIDAANAIFKITAAAPPVSRRSRAIAIISSAHPLEKAREARFTSALRAVLLDPGVARGWSDKDEMLRPDAIATAVEDALGGEDQSVDCIQKGLRTDFIPNPRFRRGVVAGDVETDRKLSFAFETSDHFVLASRGIEVGEIGWYFTGRRRLLADLVAWLSTARSGLAIVTGPPGAGKSAIVGRLATLSSAPYRRAAEALGLLAYADPSTLPREGSVDVAIHAKGKTLDDCARAVASALALPLGGEVQIAPEQLLAAIDALDQSLTIIFDALDEAAVGAEAIARNLIAPLSQLRRVRVLVGTRRSLDGAVIPKGEDRHGRLRAVFGAAAHIYDLDDEAETDRDIADYVRLRLGENRGPEEAEAVARMAKRVAEASGGIFLYARVVSRTLRDQDLDQAVELPASAIEAFVFDLNNRFGSERQRVDDLLRALAWGAGTGLSRHVWGPIATALSPARAHYAEEDVRWVLANVGWHIVETGAETAGVQQATYRLIHQAFVDHYQSRWEPAEAHRRIAEAISAGMKGEAWLDADNYLWRHLSQHAAAAGLLDRLIEDPGYLATAEPPALAIALRGVASDRARRFAGIYLRTANRLVDLKPSDRAPLIHMTAQMEARELAQPLRPPMPVRWTCSWAHCRPSSAHQVIGCHTNRITAFTVGEVDGKLIAISAGRDKVIRRWDAATATPFGPPIELPGSDVMALAFGLVDDRPVIFSAAMGEIARWCARTGVEIGPRIAGHDSYAGALAFGLIGGRPTIVSGGGDKTVRLWDARTGKGIGRPVRAHDDTVSAVAIGKIEGRDVIVSGGHDNMLRIWDATTRSAIGEPLRGHTRWVSAVAVGRTGAGPIIVSGGHDHTVRRWNPLTGQAIGGPIEGALVSVETVELGEYSGKPAIFSGSFQDINIWDAATGEQLCYPLEGHPDSVMGVAHATLEGRPVILSAGASDATVRLWDVPAPLGGTPDNRARVTSVGSLALGIIGNKPILITPNAYTVESRDPATGRKIPRLSASAAGFLRRVTLDEEEAIIAAAAPDGSIQAWHATNGNKLATLLAARVGEQPSIALGRISGRPVLAVGSNDLRIRIWDLAEPLRRARADTLARGAVYDLVGLAPRPQRVIESSIQVDAIAMGDLDGIALLVAGGSDHAMERWDAGTGQLMGKTDTGDWITSLAFGGVNGQAMIISGGFGSLIGRWDARTGEAIGKPLLGHTGTVNSVALNLLGALPVIVSGSDDHTIRLWSAQSGELLLTIAADIGVEAAMVSPKGQLVFGTGRGVVALQLAPGLGGDAIATDAPRP